MLGGSVHCRRQAVLLAFQPLTWMDGRKKEWSGALHLGHHPEGRDPTLLGPVLTDQLSNGPLGPLF